MSYFADTLEFERGLTRKLLEKSGTIAAPLINEITQTQILPYFDGVKTDCQRIAESIRP